MKTETLTVSVAFEQDAANRILELFAAWCYEVDPNAEIQDFIIDACEQLLERYAGKEAMSPESVPF